MDADLGSTHIGFRTLGDACQSASAVMVTVSRQPTRREPLRLFQLESESIFGYFLQVIGSLRIGRSNVKEDHVMGVKWAALLSSAGVLLGSATVSAQGPVPLSGMQLDNVVPAYRYDPSRYQLRVAVEAVLAADPDRVRNALLTEDSEAAMAAQQMPAEEPEARCTPARRALLALARRSELAASEATPQQGSTLTTSAPPSRQAASAAASRRDQRLAAANPDPAITGGGQPTAVGDLGSNTGQAAKSSIRPPAATSAGAAGKRAPASAVASRAPQVEVPVRTVRSDNHARPSGASAVRAAPGANAADIVARVRSEVNRTLSAVQGGAFRLR
jgi:hypothetical protein